jgi:hypothetical protein
MRPTRRNVLSDPYYKIPRDRVWLQQRQPHLDPPAGRRNLEAVLKFEAGLRFHRDEDFYEHELAEAPLRDVLDQLLVTYEVRGSDLANWYAQLVVIADILDDEPHAIATWVRMYGDRRRERVRSTADDVVKLHQGEGSGKKDGGYRGDAALFMPRGVTIQAHVLLVDDLPHPVAGLAVHIPKELRRDDTGAMGER